MQGAAALAQAIARCRICRDEPMDGAEPLPHEPRPVAVISTRAKVLIAGQAPGLKVHETGLPFNDASGNRLRDWLNVSRDEFYDPNKFAIVPMGFCFPGYDAKGGDLPPRKECATQWRANVMAAMPQIRIVLTIGQYAQSWHLGALRRRNMTETVRAWRDVMQAGDEVKQFPLPHPSWRNTGWIRRNPWFESELLPELQQVIRSHID